MPTDKNSKWEQENGKAYRETHNRSTYDRVTITLRKDGKSGITKRQIEEHARLHKKSVAEFIIGLVREHIDGEENVQ